jgi:hypothetical protein
LWLSATMPTRSCLIGRCWQRLSLQRHERRPRHDTELKLMLAREAHRDVGNDRGGDAHS